MRSGNLRHRLQFQEPTITRDSTGGVINSYSTYMTVWGSAEAARGSESLESSAISGQQKFKFMIRYDSRVKIKHQILFDSRIFEINTIDNHQERNIYLILTCTESI